MKRELKSIMWVLIITIGLFALISGVGNVISFFNKPNDQEITSTGDNTMGTVMIIAIPAIFLIIALFGLFKPVFQRFSGRSESLKQQKEQNELLREQNEIYKNILEKDEQRKAN